MKLKARYLNKFAFLKNELVWLKNYLTMTDAQKGEELARNFPTYFKEYVESRYPDYLEKFPQDEDDYLDDFSVFPPKLLEGFLESEGPSISADDPADAPCFLTLEFENVVKNQWLIHFTDDAYGIATRGFLYGMDDMTKLALTTWFKDSAKKFGGYNFAFDMNNFSRYMGSNSRPKYGSECVIFRASGVKCWHSGDEEPQVIFWGADARDIVPIRKGDYGGDWQLPTDDHDKPVFQHEDLDVVVGWVMNNYPQYQRMLQQNGRRNWGWERKKIPNEVHS